MPQRNGTFAVSDAVELAVTTRGGFVESRHAGTAIVLSANGDQLVSLGNPAAKILTRSALKPLQSLAMHTAGLELADSKQLALSFASHTGTAAHTAVVEQMLKNAGLSTAHLLCPAAYPVDEATAEQVMRAGAPKSPLYMGCSGKHAAMLSTCLAAGWSVADYTDPEHPLQQHIVQTVQRLTTETPSPITVDGCGAPVLGLSLNGLARGFRRMATASADSPFPVNRQMAAIFTAGRTHPQLVEGPGAQDSIVMQETGVFAKYGAEGVAAMAGLDGTVAVVKMLDGSSRASRIVALSLLAYVGSVSKKSFVNAMQKLPLQITGGKRVVGEIRPSIPALMQQD